MKLGPPRGRLGYTFGELASNMNNEEMRRFLKLIEGMETGYDPETGDTYVFPWDVERLLEQVRNGS